MLIDDYIETLGMFLFVELEELVPGKLRISEVDGKRDHSANIIQYISQYEIFSFNSFQIYFEGFSDNLSKNQCKEVRSYLCKAEI